MPLTLLLTDYETLRRFLSTQGIQSFVDVEDGTVDDEIAHATLLLAGRLSQRYTLAMLMRSPFMQGLAKIVAARNICTNRGNPIPESLELRYQEIFEKDGTIDQIASGLMKLLDENGQIIVGRGNSGPVMSNLRVDRSYPNEKIRVVEETSTPVTTLRERDSARNGGYING